MEPEKSPSLRSRIVQWLGVLQRTLSASLGSAVDWIVSRYSSLISYYKSIQHDRQAKHEVKENNQKDQQAQPAKFSINDVNKPSATKEKDEKYEEVPGASQKEKPSLEARLWRMLWRRRRSILSKEAVTLILTGIIALAAVLQYLVYSEQAGIMRSSLEQNERTIILGKGQLAVAKNAADASQKTTDLMRQQLEEANKALLIYDTPFNIFAKHVNLVIRNVGHYPAKNTNAIAVITLRKVPSNQVVAFPFNRTKLIPEIPGPRQWTQDPSRDPLSFHEWAIDYLLTPQQEQGIKHGELAIAVDFSFSYNNGFEVIKNPGACYASLTMPEIGFKYIGQQRKPFGGGGSTPTCDALSAEMHRAEDSQAKEREDCEKEHCEKDR